jgi:hypothetical protein
MERGSKEIRNGINTEGAEAQRAEFNERKEKNI